MNNLIKTKIKCIHPHNIWCGKDFRWRTYISDVTKSKGRKLVVKGSEESLYQFLMGYYENCQNEALQKVITIEALYPEWIEYKRLHTTADTYITRLNSDWKTYYENTAIIKMPICDIDKFKLDVWAHTLIKNNCMKRKKYTNVQTIMRQVLEYASDLRLIPFNPMNTLKIDKRVFVKEQKKPDKTQVYSIAERKKIIELAWIDYENRTKIYELAPLALIFQFYTGLRIGELCVVKYDDIESTDYIHVQRMLRRDTKEVVPHTKTDYGDRQVYLIEEAKHIINVARSRQKELQVDSTGYIFSINGLPITERCITDLLKKYARNLDILYRSSHKIRKTYGSFLLNNGVSINTTRAMLGHSDEETTLKYYCYDTKDDAENKKMFEKALR